MESQCLHFLFYCYHFHIRSWPMFFTALKFFTQKQIVCPTSFPNPFMTALRSIFGSRPARWEMLLLKCVKCAASVRNYHQYIWCNCGHRCTNPCSRSAVTPDGPGCRPDALCLLCWLENWLSSCLKSGLASTLPDQGGGGGGSGHSADSLNSNIDWQQWPRGLSAS